MNRFFTENIMNFYQSFFPEKIFLKNYPSIFPFLARAMSPIFFKKSRLYLPQICGVAKQSKQFYSLVIFLMET